jgi:ornithine cyclodeaminase/alanine dehydrogenase-like protein (mu-crystallin family)
VLILNRSQVEALLDPDQLREALGPVMVEVSAGRVSMPARTAAMVGERKGLLGAMSAYVGASRVLACKLVSVFPGNAALGLPTHQAAVLLFDPDTGKPIAMLDGESITALRTAAGSALATRLLARTDANVMLIIGTGVQARVHAFAIARVRKLREIRVAGREPERTAAFVKEVQERLGIPMQTCPLTHESYAGADIVCAATHAEEPVVPGEWLEPGMHVNSVGLNPVGREVDEEAVIKSRVVVESRQAALNPPPSGANDLVYPIRDGLISAEHIHAEIGEILAGKRPGRTSETQITLYKSVGIAAQDAVAAQLAYDAARRHGIGLEVAF